MKINHFPNISFDISENKQKYLTEKNERIIEELCQVLVEHSKIESDIFLKHQEINTYKKENNQWIGKCHGKCRYEVMEIGTLISGYRPDGLYRIAAERINAKRQQKNASEKLQVKDVLVDIIKNETHPVARQQSICNIA